MNLHKSAGNDDLKVHARCIFKIFLILSLILVMLNELENDYLGELVRKSHNLGVITYIGSNENRNIINIKKRAELIGSKLVIVPLEEFQRACIQLETSDLIIIDCEADLINPRNVISRCKQALNDNAIIAIKRQSQAYKIDRYIDKEIYLESSIIPIKGISNIRLFMKKAKRPKLFLCAGLQSSGSTILSWCFLQRSDTAGILDLPSNGVQFLPYVSEKYAWVKMTISSFTLRELSAFFEDHGWNVSPVLIVRDLRSVYASLRKKEYGANGTTAADPPLRMRIRRFICEWEYFVDNKLPIIKFEKFLTNPKDTLLKACEDLNIEWQTDMIYWPKAQGDINGVSHANKTFRESLGKKDLYSCVNLTKSKASYREIPRKEIEWLEEEFIEYNKVNNYILRSGTVGSEDYLDIPQYEATKHYELLQIIKKLQNDKKFLQTKLKNVCDQLDQITGSLSWRSISQLRKIISLITQRGTF